MGGVKQPSFASADCILCCSKSKVVNDTTSASSIHKCKVKLNVISAQLRKR